MRLSVPLYGQRDSKWASKLLGFSKTSTIGNYGCALACMASLSAYYGKQTDPGKLNDDLKKVDGFDGAYIIWQAITKVYSDIKFTSWKDYPTVAAPVDSIKSQLNDGRPVICWVDCNPNQPGNQMHFIILTGIEGNDFYCNDPWFNDSLLFSTRYGDPVKGILGHRFFNGPTMEPPQADGELTQCMADLALERKWKNETYNELQEVKTDLDGEKKQVEFYKQVIDQYSNILGVANDTAEIAGEIQKLVGNEDTITKLSKKNEELENAVQTTNKLYEEKDKAHTLAITENKSILSQYSESQASLKKATEDLTECQLSQKFNPFFHLLGIYLCTLKKGVK